MTAPSTTTTPATAQTSAANDPSVFTITEKAPTRAFSWLKVPTREVLMGEGNGVASVIMLTFTKMPAPHADFYKDARPPC